MKQRFVTAAVLIPLVLCAIFGLSYIALVITIAGVLLLAAFEWGKLIGWQSKAAQMAYVIIVAIVGKLSWLWLHDWVVVLGVGWWCVVIIAFAVPVLCKRLLLSHIVLRSLCGMLVLIPAWVAMCLIAQTDDRYFLLYFLILIWVADTTAYLVGKTWGKEKLAPTLSPGKTIIGFISALVSAVCVAIGGDIIFFWGNEGLFLLGVRMMNIAMLTVVFAVIGDLFESMVKRYMGVKDSSNWLPGHGGLLDRIDSLTAAAPIFYFVHLYLHAFF